MKNLKVFTIAITATVLSVFSVQSYGQNLYVNAGLGYGLDAASQSIGQFGFQILPVGSFNSATTSSGTTFTNVKGSLGAGLNFGVTVGYMFSEHLGAEISFSDLSGSKMNFTTTDVETNSSLTDNGSLAANMIRIIPAFKICGEAATITPYIKAGLVLGFSGKITQQEDLSGTSGGTAMSASSTFTYTGGSSIGFMAAIGAEYKLSDKFSIFGEINMIAATWAPTTGTWTAYTLNGVNQLALVSNGSPVIPYSSQNYTFVDSYTQSGTPSTSVATQVLKTFAPMSSWGINIGVHYSFGGGSETTAPKK